MIGRIEGWPAVESGVNSGILATTAADEPGWLLFAAAIGRSMAPGPASLVGVIPFAAGLDQLQRILVELSAAGASPSDDGDVELSALLRVCLWDVRQATPGVKWREMTGEDVCAAADRHHVRVLMTRLMRAAGRQVGPGGQALAFVQRRPDTGTVYIGAWAASDQDPVLVDGHDEPALGRALAMSLGGTFEVARDFDIADLALARGVRIAGETIGVLFAAEIRGSPRAAWRHTNR